MKRLALVKLNPLAHEQTISQFLGYVLEDYDSRTLTAQERYCWLHSTYPQPV